MDASGLPLVAFILTAVGWLSREIWRWRKAKRQAAHDASETLKEKKTLLEEMISKAEDTSYKQTLTTQLDEVNAVLLGLHAERLRRTLKDAGLPTEEMLVADGLSQLQPQQVDQLKGEIAELQTLPQSDSIWDLLALGNAYYYAEQYEDAKNIYDRIINVNPNDPVALVNRGVLDYHLKRYDDSLADFNHYLQIKPDDTLALIGRGNTYASLKRYDDALADYSLSLKIKPDNTLALVERGNTYASLKRYDDALADFNRCLQIKPDNILALASRGLVYIELERYDDAITDFNHCLQIAPDYTVALGSRGIAYAHLKRYDDALADFNRCLQIKPDDPSTFYDLACLFSLWGKTGEALAYLEKAIKGDEKYREMAKADKDFDNIRDDPRFKELTASD